MTNREQTKPVYAYKLVILGETRVGKTSIILRFLKNQFNELLGSSIGAVFFTHNMEFDDCIVKLDIWDTAGQERYESLAPIYYRDADTAIVVYDITSPSSFRRAQEWVKELESSDPPSVIAFIGNKCDCDGRAVSAEEGYEFAQEHDCLFMETSAKHGIHIKELFETIARELPKDIEPDVDVNAVDIEKEKPSGGCPC
ncbi:Rab5 [Monocercomonoides exilis]|uniref:Rab5 n=1 Tax=Monocercomonoides exilis TaxID=2049356 RepID=UPI003559D812|nr:Rab5 [Monocercomonoides exilis]|eukprot:MONOS_1968.1-p1 / transcript=MONOS_1968.1 / gene=MONOS_1968 / organism=Monocercomonoides_exilis_PA203 / gene_product=Rab5 / transcript_product=Rab5 / location=Mono_scaffold00038:10090-11087(-) / protein_length=198 / sequence_SO=supercontig / SO=protein_coding / is_pseudo=false